MEPYFTVILPSYNVDKYLERCVESFLTQTYTDYEIIIVDDGSTDCTGEIADQYAEKYAFIKCIHKNNGGLSSARNAGLKKAKGKFVHMCDADDWVTPTFLEKVAKTINTYGEKKTNLQLPDIIKFNYYRHIEGHVTECKSFIEGKAYDSPTMIDYLMTQALSSMSSYVLSAWSHIYRREFLEENELDFVSERKVGSEDFLFNLEALSVAQKVYVMDEACYYYDLRMGSLTQKYREILSTQYVNLYEILCEFLEKKKKGHKEEVENMFLWQLIFGTCFPNEYKEIGEHTIADGRKRVKEICKNDEVQKIARKQLKTARRPVKIVYLMAFLLKQESVFYHAFVVGKRQSSNKRKL